MPHLNIPACTITRRRFIAGTAAAGTLGFPAILGA